MTRAWFYPLFLLVPALILPPAHALAQPADRASIVQRLEKDGRVVLTSSGVVIETYDFVVNGDSVEAIAFHPVAPGTYPGLLLIPGFSRTARDYIPLGVRFAKDGFAAVAVTQPGFGRSAGPADFVGPRTLAALQAGLDRFRREAYVDTLKLGVFGYSRGAMAASLLAVERKDLAAAVFAAGIYDLKRAYETIGLEDIRENIKAETGLTDEALAARSSLSRMESLSAPALILHGERDASAPVEQAYLLRDRLTELGKDFEIQIVHDRDHNLGLDTLYGATLAFFQHRLRGIAPDPATEPDED